MKPDEDNTSSKLVGAKIAAGAAAGAEIGVPCNFRAYAPSLRKHTPAASTKLKYQGERIVPLILILCLLEPHYAKISTSDPNVITQVPPDLSTAAIGTQLLVSYCVTTY
jgi:hypothetical protein